MLQVAPHNPVIKQVACFHIAKTYCTHRWDIGDDGGHILLNVFGALVDGFRVKGAKEKLLGKRKHLVLAAGVVLHQLISRPMTHRIMS
jgi:hypothetical protein